jgi:two-component system, OmpR family, sensor histidine kinase KdpD
MILLTALLPVLERFPDNLEAMAPVTEMSPKSIPGLDLRQILGIEYTRSINKALKLRPIRILLTLAGLATLTYAAHSIFRVNATTAGFGYLLLVLVIASVWGFVEASVASVTATLTFNFFFFPPVGTFNIADTHNWVALLSFLGTSLIASRLSTKAKMKALDAIERQNDIERLYSFSRAILLIDNAAPFATQLMRKLIDIFQLSAASLYDQRTGEFHRAGSSEIEAIDSQLRETALHDLSDANRQSDYMLTPVKLGSEPIASLAVQGPRISASVLQGIANLVAIGLERARAQDFAQQIETARRSEQLRTTLIDAMAHEFKTPLTSIKAATTGLLANPRRLQENQRELLSIADEDAERLLELIDDTVAMARLDSTHIEINPELSQILETINEVIRSMRTELEGRHVEIAHDERIGMGTFDRRLIKLAIKQLIGNAAKYSPAGSPLEIRVQHDENTISMEITDHGEGIPEREQDRIFERFFRSPSIRQQIPGSGLGLSIAHSILKAHHGDLTVKSQPGRTTFRLALPFEYKGETLERRSNSRD